MSNETTGYGDPVTLHVLEHIQGHRNDHWTEYVLTTEGGDPGRSSVDVISRASYPVSHGANLAAGVARDMDVRLTGAATRQQPRGWTDHYTFTGRRAES